MHEDPNMKLQDAIVIITGANRGIGLAFAEAALARGARRVYAGARSPSSITTPGLVPVKLDVTSDQDVAAAARICSDVTLVVNNAGIARPGGLLHPEASEAARAQFDTNVFGIVRITQAFAPVLAKNGGGAFLNVLSAASWINSGAMTAYAVSKAAAWSLTNGLRNELRQQGTQVLGLHVGFVDTDLARGLDVVKVSGLGVQ
jgi:NAD(P)-dependent dehydrogenase (short-subunit alcohol dehydrogenase family)